MSEKDRKLTVNGVKPLKRHSVATEKATPIKRAEKPEPPAAKPLLDSVTPEASLSEAQKQPLSAREKPRPSEAKFPRPLPSEPVPKQSYSKLTKASALAPAVPMTRCPVKKEKGNALRARYTRADSVAPSREAKAPGKDGGAQAAVVKMPVDKKPFVLSAIAVFLALVIILGCIFGIRTPTGGDVDPPSSNWGDPPVLTTERKVVLEAPASATAMNSLLTPGDPDDPEVQRSYVYEYASNSSVGYSAKVLRTLDSSEIVKPVGEAKDEGLVSSGAISAYPVYGRTPSGILDGGGTDNSSKRNALIAESVYIASSNTSHNSGASPRPYNMMDAEGKLWYADGGAVTKSLEADGVTQRTLYAHTASVGMYGGNIDENEPRIVKEVTMRPRGYSGYGVTGLYAPAGEVIKIEIDEKDMAATGGLTIHIGQALYNGQANNIWTAKNQMQRFPVILNTMVVNKSTATYHEDTKKWVGYVGSFLGGPLYIRNTGAKFTATVSGCVAYSHFILGYTTEAEFNENADSSAPYFDLEVWDRGVLHSGPKRYADGKSYQDIYKAAVLWEKVATVTTTGSNQGIVFLYEAFVAAGAAVAFPGRRSVNCPEGWMASSLNYNGIVTSGAWGNFHEYHHNFQGYGVGNGGEVTNNGMTLVSYALFTKISSSRGLANYGAGSLGGWNAYTSATWALNEVFKIPKGGEPSNGKQGLTLYSALLHNFGADNYIRSKVQQQSKGYGQSYSGYLRAWQDVTHNDMTYFFKDVLCGIDEATAKEWKNSDYPAFVPVSCVYQTGRSYVYDGEKKYFQTMRPYVIPYGQPFEIDLTRYSAPDGQYEGGSIVLPEGFKYRIKSASAPANGTIEFTDDYRLKYTPGEALSSGQIVVTLQIEKEDGAFEVDDVDLVLEFELTHEINKTTLERTTYTFDDTHMYTDVTAAYGANFAGYQNKVESDHSNPTQNCNTDVWLVPDTDKGHASFPNAKEQEIAKPNQIIEVRGKLYFDEAGTYRIYLRGRNDCAMYYSTDGGKTYSLGATVKGGSGSGFYVNDPSTYVDVTVEAESWIYYKSAFITQSAAYASTGFMGLGVGQWTQTMFTISEQYCDANGQPVDSPSSDNYDRTELVYADATGQPVAVEVRKAGEATAYFTIVNNQRVPSTQEAVSKLTESKLVPPSSASYVNAYRSDYEFSAAGDFETDFFYQRLYNYDYTDNQWQNQSGQTVTATNYSANVSWNYSLYPTEKLTDGDRNTFIHTKNGVGASESKPLTFTVDIGAVKTVNRMTIYSQYRGNGDWHVPKNFTLEGSLDGENFFPVGTFTDVPRTGNGSVVTVNFDAKDFRYYRLNITGSHDSLIIIGEIEMWSIFEITGNGANHIAPANSAIVYGGKWDGINAQSSFGYVYTGSKGSTVKFEMTGTRFAVLTDVASRKNFTVWVDGWRCDSVAVKNEDAEYAIRYLSQKLPSGKHVVEIRCTGEFRLDSIALFDEG